MKKYEHPMTALKDLLYAAQRYAYIGTYESKDMIFIEKEFNKQCRKMWKRLVGQTLPPLTKKQLQELRDL